MARGEAQSLQQIVADASTERFLWDRTAAASVTALVGGTSLGGRLAELTGRSVVIATGHQLTTALALIELDGRARRLTILPSDVDRDHLDALIAGAEADAVVLDGDSPHRQSLGLAVSVECTPAIIPSGPVPHRRLATQWVLLTSGTTGVPKLVVHSLAGLTAAIPERAGGETVVWGTFYDIRRYGGLQILLRALCGGASMVLSSPGEPVGDHLARLARRGVTHLSGTPTHWRRALMSPAIAAIAPRYVRLSGEIADQAILDSLRATFPNAGVGHAYASTEAGVGFDVNDGRAGFPAAYFDPVRAGVQMKLVEGALHVRSAGSATRYLNAGSAMLADADGFIDTGDMIEQRGDRCFFTGRRGGIINVGGLKVHPEEIEAIINRHPQVRMSLVRPKKSPVTGSIVIADVVLKSGCGHAGAELQVRNDILKLCREALPRHKVPAAISFVPALAVAATGKISRRHG